MDKFYPPLPDGAVWTLDLILRRMEEDSDFLLDSPYSAEEIDLLERFVAQKISLDGVEEVEEVTDKWDRLEKESDKLFKALTDFSSKLDSKDNTETMAYFRTATSLLDKIVGIQERAANLKQINRFHETVLTVMEDILDPGQRTEVMNRLKAAITPEGS